jgi:hypothetical protein
VYEVLPRLRSRGPDLDVLRRLGVRDAFEPAPGHAFLALRLRDLKLRALAAVCRRRLGRSALADLFARGDDPVTYAAANLAGLPPGTFADLARQDPAKYDRSLRAARALLGAAPTGFTVDRVYEIVRAEAGWDEVGRAEVVRWHRRLLAEVFPELTAYLGDDSLEVMAASLDTKLDWLRSALKLYFQPFPPLPQLRKWYRGYGALSDGRTKQCLKALLEHQCFNQSLNAALERGGADLDLYVPLFCREAVTLTGRARGRLPFSQARGAECLDLADDAAKAALFAVVAAGSRVVAFAGDTLLAEVPAPADAADGAEEVAARARRGAEAVLGDIPAVCEAQRLTRW